MITTELSSPSKKSCSKVDSKRHWTNYDKFYFRKWRYRDSKMDYIHIQVQNSNRKLSFLQSNCLFFSKQAISSPFLYVPHPFHRGSVCSTDKIDLKNSPKMIEVCLPSEQIEPLSNLPQFFINRCHTNKFQCHTNTGGTMRCPKKIVIS